MKGLTELKQLLKALQARDEYLRSMHGTTYDASADSDPKVDRLHQATANMTEEESAIYARDFPEIESHFQKLTGDLDRIMKNLKKK
jgi:hypothetical protein